MTAYFYPAYLRRLFTNRVRELNFLQSIAEDLTAGHPRRVALWGLRRIGKTLLLQEQITRLLKQKAVQPAYMDFEDLCTSPEIFVQRYIGLIVFWSLANKDEPVDAYLTIERLLETTAGRSAVTAQTAASLLRELNQAKPDQALLLKIAFDFPEKLAYELGKPLILFLDEFTELTTLSHYPGIRDPLKQFRSALAGQGRVAYVVAGSAMTAMMKLFHTPEAPLFLQFETIELTPFNRQDTRNLIQKLNDNFSAAVSAEVYRYSQGYPFYIMALTGRLQRLLEPNQEAEADLVKYAFLQETMWRGGQIYNYCRYVYDLSLQQARGYGMLKAVLQILAEEEGLTLSEIARRLRKSPAAVREYLRWLMEVDLLVEQNKQYRYRDAVLRFWVAYTSKGIELDAFPKKEDLTWLVKNAEERFRQAAAELGKAKESEVRELMRRFAGQQISGALLGLPEEEVTLPTFNSVAAYCSADGQVEVDALAEDNTAGIRWAVEIKWRGKTAGQKELANLLQKTQRLNARPWFISRSGFTSGALAYAAKEGILLSDRLDLKRLSKIV
jgi:AAA+ ATPase superfamily predicted ATPase